MSNLNKKGVQAVVFLGLEIEILSSNTETIPVYIISCLQVVLLLGLKNGIT